MDLVVQNERAKWWNSACGLIVKGIPRDWTGTFDKISTAIAGRIGPPHHPNVWGALCAHAQKQGWLEGTGEWEQSVTRKRNNASRYEKLKKL
jgi:hypothetical protein